MTEKIQTEEMFCTRELSGGMSELVVRMRTEQIRRLEGMIFREKTPEGEALLEEVYRFGSGIRGKEEVSRAVFSWMASLLYGRDINRK